MDILKSKQINLSYTAAKYTIKTLLYLALMFITFSLFLFLLSASEKHPYNEPCSIDTIFGSKSTCKYCMSLDSNYCFTNVVLIEWQNHC